MELDPGLILVATRGSADLDACVLGATIGARHDSKVVLGHVGRPVPRLREELAAQAAKVLAITGEDPVIITVAGDSVERLIAMARSTHAGLMVLGSADGQASRVLAGVAQRANCSVLVLGHARSSPNQHAH